MKLVHTVEIWAICLRTRRQAYSPWMRNVDISVCRREFRIIVGPHQTSWPRCGCGFDIQPRIKQLNSLKDVTLLISGWSKHLDPPQNFQSSFWTPSRLHWSLEKCWAHYSVCLGYRNAQQGGPDNNLLTLFSSAKNVCSNIPWNPHDCHCIALSVFLFLFRIGMYLTWNFRV